jgi:oligopeptide transport system substrate-binding protein
MIRRHFLLLVAMALAGCQPSENGSEVEPVRTATLRRGIGAEPRTLDPQTAISGAERIVIADLFVGLVKYGADGEVRPALAESWRVSANGRQYLFRLRPGLRWSDGRPITGADVVYSLRRAVDPATGAASGGVLAPIRNAAAIYAGELPVATLGVIAADERHVRIDLVGAHPNFTRVLAHPVAAVVPRQTIERHGERWTAQPHIVVNGAYSLRSWRPQRGIRVSRNPYYYGRDTVDIPEIAYFPAENEAAALLRFRGGQLDIVETVPQTMVARLRRSFGQQLRVHPKQGSAFLLLNTARPPLNDPRVRHALSMLVARDRLAHQILGSGEQPAWSLVPPDTPGACTQILPYFAGWDETERLTQARYQLRNAGYTRTRPLRVRLSYATGGDRKRVAAVIAHMWREAGIITTLRSMEGKVHSSRLFANDFDIALAGYEADYHDPLAYLLIAGPRRLGGFGVGAPDAAFDAILAAAQKPKDVRTRDALLVGAQQRLIAQQPIIPLYYSASRALVSEQVRGWVDNRANVHPSETLSIR